MRPTLFAAGALAVLAGGCSRPAPPPPPPPTVTVAHAETARVVDRLDVDGTVAASASVDVVARVPGVLQSAPFREGAAVRAGDVLAVIEPEPYRQQVRLAQAQVDQARAEAARQRTLLAEQATATSSVEKADSARKQAEANLRLAQINLGYTTVRAPFDGVVGRRQVDVGNVVGAGGATVLATVVRVQPAYVRFTVGERDLLRLRAHPGAARPSTAVDAALQGEARPSAHCKLDFVDTGLAGSSGALAMRASFDNADGRLVPGLYARVSLPLGAARDARLLPETAVQSDQQGAFVYVVDAQQRVARRDLRLGATFDHRREVLAGLGADERVIVDGLARITPGAAVVARDAPPSPASSPTPEAAS